MKKLLVAAGSIAALLSSTPSFAAMGETAANGAELSPVPVDYWAVRGAISSVSVSPDGKHMALMRITSKDGDPIIEVYDTDDLSKAPIRANAEPMEITGRLTWVSDDVFFGTAMQVVQKSVKGAEDDVRRYKSFAYNINTKKFSQFETPTGKGVFILAGLLPNEPRNILVATSNGPEATASDDPAEAFRPRSFYRYNIDSAAKSLVLRGGGKQPSPTFDINGNPRFAQSVDVGSDEFVFYYRGPNETNWTEILRQSAEDWDRMDFSFEGDVKGKPGVISVLARNNGEDKIALWEFDTKTKAFGSKIWGTEEADILGTFSGNFWSGDDEIKGVIYPGAKVERHYFDASEKALMDKIKPAIQNAFDTRILSRSRDGNTMTVLNVAPRDSGTYYLIKDGRLQKIGSTNPLLSEDDFSDVEYIKYPARDGLTIPAYVTKPKGQGPFPLIVLPHGGPYVNEVIVYDEWSQMLANNGYMVIQPQYRGSEGHGWNHFIKTWHEHGLAMNDDLDDGAKYLIDKGLVDADRVAMFGWSYGGYAALVAASRENNIYQCTIPGAFVADPLMSYNGRKNDAIKYFDDFSAQRGGKVGISPMDEVDKVNVPMLLIHGDWDRRVLFKHYTNYKKALEKAGKADNMKFLPLKGADHFLSTHRYEHNQKYYSAILEFLKEDCGPGGL